MKKISFFFFLCTIFTSIGFAQKITSALKAEKEIHVLIENYTNSRENQDTVLLNSILTPEIDQLVSTGEWRYGKEGAMKGMMRSSESNPGKRTITVDKIRFLNPECAITDARYEIENSDGTTRKMWSTFIVVYQDKNWKITAIRNMKPAN